MGSLLWARTEIRDGWRSLVVVAGLVAVVVGSVLALLAGAERAGSAPDRFADATDLADIVVFVGDRTLDGLDDRIAAVDGVDRVVVSAVMKLGAGTPAGPLSNGIIGMNDTVGGSGRPLLIAGRYPEPGKDDEVLLNERGADGAGIEPGDRVPITALPCFDDCDPVSIGDAVVVGLVRLSEDLIDDPGTQLTILAGPALADGRWREAEQAGTILSVHVADGVDSAPLTAYLSTLVGAHGNVSDQEVDTETVDRAASLQRDALLLAAAVAAGSGAVVVVQAVARHLQRRPSDAAILGAIGLGRRQRTMAAVASMLPAVLPGALAGVALAAAASPVFPLASTRSADPDRGFQLDAAGLAIGGVVTLIALVAIAAAAATRWATTTPTPIRTGQGAAGAVIKSLRLRPAPATGARFALDSGAGRQRLPVVPTLLAVTATVALGVAAIVVHTNLGHMLATPERFGQPWVYSVTGRVDHEAAMLELADDPRVSAADLARGGEVNVRLPDGKRSQLKAIGIDGVGGPTGLVTRSGRPPVGVEEVAIAGETMAALGVAVGDRIILVGACGQRSAEVVGEAIVPLVDKGDPGEGIVLSLAGFEALCAGELAASIDRTSDLLLQFDDADDADAFEAEFVARDVIVDRRFVPTDINSLRGVRQVPVAVGIAVTGFGLVTVVHALVLAVRRRRRDLGVLRALGMRPREASATVRWQALTIAVVAALTGVPVGLAAGRALWLAIARPIHVLLDVELPLAAIAAAVAAVSVTAVAVAVIPSRRATRVAPAEVLRSE